MYADRNGKISVIMPAYNVELYIAESIESVLKQTYENFELIVINDGSRDATKDIVQSFIERDERVRLYNQENGGLPIARNAGMERATGEYITFLDADDLWEPQFLEKVYQRSRELDAADVGDAFVYARTKETFIDGHESILGPADCVSGRLEKFIHYTNELRLRFHVSAVLIKREIITRHNLQFLPGIKMSEDTGFFIELLCVAEAYYVDDMLTIYRRRESSMTTEKWDPAKWRDAIVVYERIEPFVKDKYAEALSSFYRLRNYHTYRFVLKCLRRGFVEEAKKSIERWRLWLKEFSQGDGKLNDRLKCRLLLCSNETILQLISKVRL